MVYVTSEKTARGNTWNPKLAKKKFSCESHVCIPSLDYIGLGT